MAKNLGRLDDVTALKAAARLPHSKLRLLPVDSLGDVTFSGFGGIRVCRGAIVGPGKTIRE